ncbi:MAG: FtsW/RodA/SpoVE family cell cycle protein [Microthrixaceae bacterium]
MAAVDYRRVLAWWPVVYGVAIAALVGVLTPLGATVNGTSGWYRLGPASFQPAELAKLATILAVAAYLGAAERVDWRRLLVALGLLGAPLALVLLQPDLGSALVFAAISLGMLLVGGVRLRDLAVLGVVAVAAVALVLGSGRLDEYQQDRLSNFLSTDGQSYNVTQAQTAISSGGLTGYGFGRGPRPGADSFRCRSRTSSSPWWVRSSIHRFGATGGASRGDHLADLAGGAVGGGPCGHADLCRGDVDVPVPHLREHRYDPRDHAGDGHSVAVRVLRRHLDRCFVCGCGTGRIGSHAPFLPVNSSRPDTGTGCVRPLR